MDYRSDHESLSLNEIIETLVKNRFFIVIFLVGGILAGLLLSFVKYLQDPIVYRHQAVVQIDLVPRRAMDSQPRTFLYLMESKPIMDISLRRLKMDGTDYIITTSSASIPDRYNVFVEGPDETNVIRLANEIVAQGMGLVENSMNMETIEVAENAVPFELPIPSGRNINILPNVGMLTVLAGMLSVILIFLIRFLRGGIYSKAQAEYILGTKMIVTIPPEKTRRTLKSMLKVR